MAGDALRIASDGELEEFLGGSTGGIGDANKLVKFDSNGQLTLAAMPTGVGAQTHTGTASEALAAGDYVEVFDNAGTKSIRKASAASGSARPADGFVIAGVVSAATATVYNSGLNGAVTGIAAADIGKPVFLSSTTPGGFTFVPPSAVGQVLQRLGIATAAGQIATNLGPKILRA
jgi:hypothetical protein